MPTSSTEQDKIRTKTMNSFQLRLLNLRFLIMILLHLWNVSASLVNTEFIRCQTGLLFEIPAKIVRAGIAGGLSYFRNRKLCLLQKFACLAGADRCNKAINGGTGFFSESSV